MAYTEYVIYGTISKTYQLMYYQDSDTAPPYTNAEYLAVRNAAAANITPPDPDTYLGLGQWRYTHRDEYGDPDAYFYEVSRIATHFINSASIPVGSVIEYAAIDIYVSNDQSVDADFDIVVQNGQPDYPSDPPVLDDYSHENYSGNGGELTTLGLTENAYNRIELNETGISWLTIGAPNSLIAKLLLRSSRDISAIAPDFRDRISVYNVSTYQIRLIIRVNAAPTVTTQAATQIAYHCAIGNGTITSGTNATERGFETKVYVDYFGVGADLTWGMMGFNDEGEIVYHDFGQRTGYLVKRDYLEGDFEEGVFEDVLGHRGLVYDIWGTPDYMFNDMLEKCTSYTYRAYAVIDDEPYYGEWVEFSTLCENAPPTDDISDGDPTVPIIPIDIPTDIPTEPYPPFEWEFPPEIPYPPWDWDLPDLPPWILPDLPEWEIPDYPPMSFVGDFYYHKPYTKKDLDELRKKCIIYNKNSVEFALVLRHNMNVLREFFNMMTDYMDKDEFNDFTDIIPPQRLKELYLDPLEVNDFKDMINGFIRNTVDNNIAVNRNFSLIQEGLTDPQANNEEGYFTDIYSAMKTVTEDNPDVDTLKRVVDNLNQETASNFNTIMHNLEILRARLL